MTISSISPASPIMSASVMQNVGRAPDTTPDSSVTAGSINSPASTSLNSAHSNGSDSIRTGLQIIPSPNEALASLQSSASQIARLQSNPQLPTARAASEAYQTQAGALTQVMQAAQVSGSPSVNMLA